MAAAKKTTAAKKAASPKPKARATKPKAASKAKPSTTTKEEPIAQAAIAPREESGNVLERGDLFFFYRPDADEEAPHGLLDVRRFHLILRPERGDIVRIITIGRKTLPGSGAGGANHWAFVDRVFADAGEVKDALGAIEYETETTGQRHLPAARPAGEGVYALARHGRESILAYALELPEEPGEVQKAFGIEQKGRFVVSIKNPDSESPAGLGLDEGQKGDLPEELKAMFGARRWHPADPPAFLDHPGVELILIGGRVAPEDDLGIELDPQPEDQDQAEVFRDLGLEKTDQAIRPLFEGEWA